MHYFKYTSNKDLHRKICEQLAKKKLFRTPHGWLFQIDEVRPKFGRVLLKLNLINEVSGEFHKNMDKEFLLCQLSKLGHMINEFVERYFNHKCSFIYLIDGCEIKCEK